MLVKKQVIEINQLTDTLPIKIEMFKNDNMLASLQNNRLIFY